MKVYLAAPYTLRKRMVGYAERLHAAGHEVTSRWIYGGHEVTGAEEAGEIARFAFQDLADIGVAEAVILFTEPPGKQSSRGGRHTEFGWALARGKRLIVVGPRENIFHWLPEVEQFETLAEAVTLLEEET